MRPTLSVVIISKNQAWNLDRILGSILRETSDLGQVETLLVDSASSDDTLDLASRYSIRILQIAPGQHMCASAGRHVGFINTRGEYVLFHDGDHEAFPGWIGQALSFLHDHPQVAGVGGERISPGTDRPVTDGEYYPRPFLGAAAMYRRRVLEEVGDFNPYLYSDEEPELGVRIRQAGYSLVHLSLPCAIDHGWEPESVSKKIARWRRGLYLGAGQALRYHLGKETFWQYLIERGFGVMPLVFIVTSLIALLYGLVTEHYVWIGAWMGILTVWVLTDAVRKRSLNASLTSIVHRLVIADGTVRGFLRRPVPADSYRPELIKVA